MRRYGPAYPAPTAALPIRTSIAPTLGIVARTLSLMVSFGYRLPLALLALLLAAAALHAQPYRTVYVGTGPAALFYDLGSNRLNVLGVGLDRNFNGVYEPDSGDVSASWYVVDPISGAKLDSTLLNGFFSNFPLRVGVDVVGRHLYACVNNAVNEYDLDSRNLDHQIWQGNFSGVSYDAERGLVLMHERDGVNPGRIIAYRTEENNNRIEYVLPTGVSPLMTSNYSGHINGRVENYTLCEGTFGQPNSAISYTMYEENDFGKANGDTLGSGARAMVRGLADLYIALGSQVRIVDAATGTESFLSPIDLVGASAMKVIGSSTDGSDSLLVVGTDSGYVYWYDMLLGTAIDSVNVGGPVKTMEVLDTGVFVGYDVNGNEGRVVALGWESHAPYDTLATTAMPLKLYADQRSDLQLVGMYSSAVMPVVRQVLDPGTGDLKSEDTLRSNFVLNAEAIDYDMIVDSLFIAYNDSLLVYGGVGGSAAHTAIDTFNLSFAVPRTLSLAGDLMLVSEGPRVIIFDLLAWRAIGMFNTPGMPVAMAMATSDQGSGDAHAVVALSEGQAGANLSRVEYNQNVFIDTLGNGANSMISNQDNFAIVMNGSHQIVLANPWAGQILLRVNTLTSGFDGPREMAVGEDSRYVVMTTYKGDVRSFDEDGNLGDSLDIGGKGEAVIPINDTLIAITRPLNATYGPDSALILLDPRNINTSDVRREDAVAGSAVRLEECAPNPASTSTSVKIAVPRAGRVQLRVVDTRGNVIATAMDQTMEAGTWSAQLDVSALPAGNYILVVSHPAGQAQRILHVVR